MYIKELHLQNFKRFTDLKINLSESPEPYKLVLLVGANGSGKSSVFDAFEVLSRYSKKQPISNPIDAYYKKNISNSITISISTDKYDSKLGDNEAPSKKPNSSDFYGRSSLRQIPRLTRTSLGQQKTDLEEDSDRPKQYIDRDNRFENDIEILTQEILEEVFTGENFDNQKLKEKYLRPINDSLSRIFGDTESSGLELIALKPPLGGQIADVRFRKGVSNFRYELLSAGEKEVINILLNLFVRRNKFQNTVYFLDEIDLHLNTKLQYRLLQEITEHWIPENCQLWTASHSLGFIDYANDYEKAAIIDFDELDFDVPQVLYPQPKNKFDVFEIAVSQEFLTKLFEGKSIIFAENTDAPYYNNLKLKDIIFFTAIDKYDVFYKAKNTNYQGIIDRDFLTDEEVELIREKYSNLHILDFYSIENYLYHPENLEEHFKSTGKEFNKDNYIQNWIAEKSAKREDIIFGLQGARNSYPFFKENENAKLLKAFKSNAKKVMEILQSDTFEVFYKFFPEKDYGKTIPERNNLTKETLAQTNWFRKAIENIIFS